MDSDELVSGVVEGGGCTPKDIWTPNLETVLRNLSKDELQKIVLKACSISGNISRLAIGIHAEVADLSPRIDIGCDVGRQIVDDGLDSGRRVKTVMEEL